MLMGVAAIIYRHPDHEHRHGGLQFLLGERKDSGIWCNLGGKPEEGETAEQTCCRELREEAGVDIDPMWLRAQGFKTSHLEDGTPYVVLYYSCPASALEGVPKSNDPKIGALKWVQASQLSVTKMWAHDREALLSMSI